MKLMQPKPKPLMELKLVAAATKALASNEYGVNIKETYNLNNVMKR